LTILRSSFALDGHNWERSFLIQGRKISSLISIIENSRNHNGNYNIQQDPAVWGEEFAAMTRNILQHRYRLLPYLYTLMYRASVFGDTVIRPLFANWPEDKTTHTIDEQMMWADGLLVSPVLTQEQFKIVLNN